jgi:MoaA/NifB/PqqE/SkfB family radical SAM enzyme
MITLDWNFNRTCNFKCEYCINGPFDRVRKNLLGPTFEEAKAAIDRLTLDYSWVLSGGEVFLNKDFVKICKYLTEKYRVGVNTNLSLPVDEFAREIDPSKVHRFLVSLHIEERDRLGVDRQQLVNNVSKLRDANFRKIFIIQIMNDYAISVFDDIFEWYLKRDIYIIPRRAKSSDWYTCSYSEEQIKKIEYYEKACDEDDDIRANHFVIPKRIDTENKGKQCSSGRDYFVIDHTGVVKECWQSTNFFGNFFGPLWYDEKRILAKDRVCPYEFCSCTPFAARMGMI